LGNVGWTCVDEFQRLSFHHKAEKFLVWFSFKDDGFSIEAFVKKDLVWRKLPKSRVSENKLNVNVSLCLMNK
jgi:hypothetical protein